MQIDLSGYGNFSVLVSHADVRKLGGWAMRTKLFLTALQDISEPFVLNQTAKTLYRVVSLEVTARVELEEVYSFNTVTECQTWLSETSDQAECMGIIFRQITDYQYFNCLQGDNIFVDIDDLKSDTVFESGEKAHSFRDIRARIRSILERFKEKRSIHKAPNIFRIRGDRKADTGHPSSLIIPASSQNYLDSYQPSASDSKQVLFVGSADHGQNRFGIEYFINHCLAACIEEVPGFNFVIVSQATMPVSKEFLQKIGQLKAIEVKSNVIDIRPFYLSSAIFINSNQEGLGSSIKTVEGFLMGRTGVVSPIGIRGLTSLHKKDCVLVEDQPGVFCDSVIKLLLDYDFRQKLESNAFNYSYKQYHPAGLIKQITGFIKLSTDGKVI